ncbi:MAG: recombinase RecT [Planctomycetes bacterium]|nr:recombinase RecT [Planctomycetota bacterium]
MSDALAVRQSSLAETRELAKELSVSALLPAALKKSPADVLLVVLTGQELGFGPMQSIRLLHVIEGKPCLSADGMGALCMRHPSCELLRLVSSDGKAATYEAKRRGAEPVRLTFTIEQAKAAGLLGKGNWSKFPEAMLRARCLSAICRAVWPDAVAGVYDPDELGAAPIQATPSARVVSVDAEFTTEPDSVTAAAAVAPDMSEPLRWLQEASTLAELGALTPRIQSAGVGKDGAFRAAYAARMAELKGGAK